MLSKTCKEIAVVSTNSFVVHQQSPKMKSFEKVLQKVTRMKNLGNILMAAGHMMAGASRSMYCFAVFGLSLQLPLQSSMPLISCYRPISF